MAIATAQQRREVRRDPRRDVKEYTYLWEGVDRSNRNVRGEMKGASETVVTTTLRRQGIVEDLRIMSMTLPVMLFRRGGW